MCLSIYLYIYIYVQNENLWPNTKVGVTERFLKVTILDFASWSNGRQKLEPFKQVWSSGIVALALLGGQGLKPHQRWEGCVSLFVAFAIYKYYILQNKSGRFWQEW